MWSVSVVTHSATIEEVFITDVSKVTLKWNLYNEPLPVEIFWIVTSFIVVVGNAGIQKTSIWNITVVKTLRLSSRSPFLICTLHGLAPLPCSDSELTSEIMNHFRHFGRSPWTHRQPIPGPLLTQDSTTQTNKCNTIPRARFEPTIPVFQRKEKTCAP